MYIVKNVAGLLMAILFFSACTKRDVLPQDNVIEFETTEQGFGQNDTEAEIRLRLSSAADRDIPVRIFMSSTAGVEYGTDFTTTPAAQGDTIYLTILSGNREASVKVTKQPGALFYADDELQFRIVSSGHPVIIGSRNQTKLSFTEILSTADTIRVNGGGATYGNKVFFDISANRQDAIQRTAWDLGFYSGSDFRVVLNSSTGMMARMLNTNDLTQVTAADTIGFAEDVIFSQMNPLPSQLAYIDYPDGDLDRTAIAPVAANDDDNMVYIINRGYGIGAPAPHRGWKKIRVLRSATGGYQLQHADIASSTFTTIEIGKNPAYHFNYASFNTGLVQVEPQKERWDFAWTYFSNVANFGTGEVPYLYQDVILLNRGVEAAKVMTSFKNFADFNAGDISAQTFSDAQNAIGADWRSGGGPTSAPEVRTDRYYIIKDPNGLYYKVRFTALTQGGERGYPAFEYVLLQ